MSEKLGQIVAVFNAGRFRSRLTRSDISFHQWNIYTDTPCITVQCTHRTIIHIAHSLLCFTLMQSVSPSVVNLSYVWSHISYSMTSLIGMPRGWEPPIKLRKWWTIQWHECRLKARKFIEKSMKNYWRKIQKRNQTCRRSTCVRNAHDSTQTNDIAVDNITGDLLFFFMYFYFESR